MCPVLSISLCKQMQKPAVLSLKQFMMRSEILKLYRGFMRLGKMLNEPSPELRGSLNKSKTPMRDEWTDWVRSEFRIRINSPTTDEDATRTLLVYGKRQLEEMERTIMLATNRNTSLVRPPPSTPPSSPCSSTNKKAKRNDESAKTSQNINSVDNTNDKSISKGKS